MLFYLVPHCVVLFRTVRVRYEVIDVIAPYYPTPLNRLTLYPIVLCVLCVAGDVLIEPLCPESPKQSISASPSRPFGRASTSTSTAGSGSVSATSPSIGVSSSSSRSSERVAGAGAGAMMSTTAGAGTGTAVRERKGTCVAYTPISVCSRNVVSCFRGEEGEEDDSEPAVQVPWIAHVLMGSGEDPDTYLDINLIQ